MDELKLRLIEGYKSGRLLYAIAGALRSEKVDVAAQLSALHNDGIVDVVAAFEGLENRGGSGIDFFLTADVFRRLLPTIDSPVEPVMATVAHLHKAAGADLAAGMIFEGFIGFCAKDQGRPAATLRTIEADPNRYADLLPATLIAGSRIDARQYYAETIRLLGSSDVELRRRATFALGRLATPTAAVLDAAFAALENAASSEVDVAVLAAITKSAFGLLQHDNSREARVLSLVDPILEVGNDHVLHAASEIIASTSKNLSTAVSTLVLNHLQKAKPENRATLSRIDFAVSQLLNGLDRKKGLEFIERYLLAHQSVELEVFGVTAQQIGAEPKLVGTLLTRWFLRGDRILCSSIAGIVRDLHVRSSSLEVDPAEIQPMDPGHIVFLARKTLGYLFLYPVPAASILVSLMKQTEDEPTLEAVGELLHDPLLMSYPGSAREFVAQQAKAASGKVKATLMTAQNKLEIYLEALKSMPNIPALLPSEEQRETHNRRFSRLVARSYKEVQKGSPFLSLIRKSVLLYGDKSVHHVQEPGGQSKRVETPMKSFGTSFEVPRMDHIDPVGLDIFLRTCKSERIAQ